MTASKATYFGYLAERTDIKTLYIHDEASTTIARMFAQVERIHDVYGPGREYVEATRSLNYCLHKLLLKGFGLQSYVTKDSDDVGLSLLIQEGDTFVCGMIFFRDRTYDGTEREGIAGTWSMHS